MAINARRDRAGAYSLRKSAVPMATGTPTMTAMTEMMIVPYIWAAAPKWYGLWAVPKPEVVK